MAKIMGWTEYPSTWKPGDNIDQAMLVVNKLLKDCPTLTIRIEISLNKTVVQFIDVGYAVVFDQKVEAETPQMALCLAAANFEKLEDSLYEFDPISDTKKD